MTSETTRETVVSPPGKEKERENLSVASKEKEKRVGKEVSAKPRAPESIALRVTLADGSTATGALPLGATLGDARAYIANQKENDEPFEIWNTWPRERVDSGEEADAHERARTLESLGLGVRPSLLVVRPRGRRGRATKKTSPPRKKKRERARTAAPARAAHSPRSWICSGASGRRSRCSWGSV